MGELARGATPILDGPVGTELAARGVPTPAPLWSAAAIRMAPEVLGAIHADYAAAGATVHTAATFRTTPRAAGDEWENLLRRAVEIARRSVPAHHRVAGSLAPLEDCYRPDRSPANPRPEHRAIARALAAAGVDVILCETFPHVGEALVAVEEAVATGVETWVAFTAGPDATLLGTADVKAGAIEARARGARLVAFNCTAATLSTPYVEALAELGMPFGVYANAGAPEDGIGWGAEGGPERYARLAERWIALGATLVGSCCGTGPAHVARLAAMMVSGGDGVSAKDEG